MCSNKAYKSKWKDSNFEFGKIIFGINNNNDVKYFVPKSGDNSLIGAAGKLVGKYRRVMTDTGTMYIDDNETLYYMKVYNNDRNQENYVIVESTTGNLLTKPVTAPEAFNAKTVDENTMLREQVSSGTTLGNYWKVYTREPNSTEIPNDTGQIRNDNGRYIYSDANHVNLDYRIPALERVYHKSTFNLSEDSCYSYFQIPELKRVNYTYLNVNELNYTSDKKPSDDMFFITKRAEWID